MGVTTLQNKPKTGRHKILNGFLCLLAICMLNVFFGDTSWARNAKRTPQTAKAQTTARGKKHKLKPMIPSANRHQKGKVFLEYADKLWMDKAITPDYQVLSGNVKFRKGDMFMYCDSAHLYDKTNSLFAFGNVKMEQGDTLFVYADRLYYNGVEELARLRDHVRMENRNVTLFTDSFDYDMIANIGYYFEGGKIVDDKNELTSVYGQYAPDTKDSEFLFDVELTNERSTMKTDTLFYNTNTHIADIVGYTTILSDSNTIYSDKGWYNTASDKATLYDRSLVIGKDGQTLTGDTIYYDRNTGYGEVFGNMVLVDSAKSTTLQGEYGYHNEKLNTSFATKRAFAMEYSQKDTLFLHGDTIRTYLLEDSSRVMCAYPSVRFYRTDIQGLCDSLTFVSRDSLLYMHKHPILWNTNRQITGNIIKLHFNDSTVDRADLPEFGFMAEHVEDEFYNQLSGKEMIAYLENKTLKQLDVNGNVLAIMLPQEDDSTYNKLVNAEGSFLIVKIKDQKIDKLTLWPDVSGKVTPLFLAKKSQYYLKGFKWYESIRPKDRYDIFVIPDEMKQLFSTPETIVPARKIREEED